MRGRICQNRGSLKSQSNMSAGLVEGRVTRRKWSKRSDGAVQASGSGIVRPVKAVRNRGRHAAL